jgi:hypothetical protein
VRLADEYDAAQENGEVQKAGGPRGNQHAAIIPDGNNAKPVVTDISLTAKQIHEARLIRDAEAAEQGKDAAGHHRRVCPDCGGLTWRPGPRGGLSRNIECNSCHARFNVAIYNGTVVMAEKIDGSASWSMYEDLPTGTLGEACADQLARPN